MLTWGLRYYFKKLGIRIRRHWFWKMGLRNLLHTWIKSWRKLQVQPIYFLLLFIAFLKALLTCIFIPCLYNSFDLSSYSSASRKRCTLMLLLVCLEGDWVLGVVLPARWGWGWVNTLPGKRVETFKKETFKRSFQKVILS